MFDSDLEFSLSNLVSDLEFSFSNPGLFEFQVRNNPELRTEFQVYSKKSPT